VQLREGAAGVVGPVIVDLYVNAAGSGAIASGQLASGRFTGNDLTGITMDSVLVLFHTTNAYVNLTTTGTPAGLIRGQVYRN